MTYIVLFYYKQTANILISLIKFENKNEFWKKGERLNLKNIWLKSYKGILKFEIESICLFIRGGATVPIFKTQLRSVFPGPPIYFTDFIFCMVISYYHIRMGI